MANLIRERHYNAYENFPSLSAIQLRVNERVATKGITLSANIFRLSFRVNGVMLSRLCETISSRSAADVDLRSPASAAK